MHGTPEVFPRPYINTYTDLSFQQVRTFVQKKCDFTKENNIPSKAVEVVNSLQPPKP